MPGRRVRVRAVWCAQRSRGRAHLVGGAFFGGTFDAAAGFTSGFTSGFAAGAFCFFGEDGAASAFRLGASAGFTSSFGTGGAGATSWLVAL